MNVLAMAFLFFVLGRYILPLWPVIGSSVGSPSSSLSISSDLESKSLGHCHSHQHFHLHCLQCLYWHFCLHLLHQQQPVSSVPASRPRLHSPRAGAVPQSVASALLRPPDRHLGPYEPCIASHGVGTVISIAEEAKVKQFVCSAASSSHPGHTGIVGLQGRSLCCIGGRAGGIPAWIVCFCVSNANGSVIITFCAPCPAS